MDEEQIKTELELLIKKAQGPAKKATPDKNDSIRWHVNAYKMLAERKKANNRF